MRSRLIGALAFKLQGMHLKHSSVKLAKPLLLETSPTGLTVAIISFRDQPLFYAFDGFRALKMTFISPLAAMMPEPE